MRLPRLELVLCAVWCVASCARPTLDEVDDSGIVEDEDAGKPVAHPDAAVAQPEKDAGVVVIEPPPGRDAATPVITLPSPDAGTSSDDAGDKLPPVLANCSSSTAIATDDSLGSGVITQIQIDGQLGKLAQVKPGQQVAVQVMVMFDSCGPVGGTAVYLGLEGNSAEQCKSAVCTVVTFPLPFRFDITAPTELGLAYIEASLSSGTPCNGSGASSPKRVAALCVDN